MIYLSLGAGQQSSALALMAACGEVGPMPDAAFFADTGDEKRATYAHLDWLEGQLPFPLVRVRRSAESLSEATLAHFAGTGGLPFTPPFFYPGGMLPKRCSKEWKTRALIAEIRRRLGLSARQRAPKGTAVTVWLGISRDEAHRMKPSEVPWITNAWPLVDRNMRRTDCIQWLEGRGHPIPPRSACVHCPFQGDAEFEGMKKNGSDDFPRAVAFDDAARNGGNGTTGPLYVHSSCKPLGEVEFGRQRSMFGNDCEGSCGT